MDKSQGKRRESKWLISLSLFLILIIGYLAYYHLYHHAKKVNGNIYSLHKVLNGHRADIWSVKFSPDGIWLASGSVDSTANIWDRESGKIILTLRQPQGITCVDFSPDGHYVATSSYDAKVRLWKLPEGLLIKEFIGHEGTVWSIHFSPDGKSIASCGEDKTIKLWNVESGQMVQAFQGHTRNVWDVKFSPDGSKVASGSFDKTLRIWNVQDGESLHVLTPHTQAIVALAYSPDGQRFASTSDDGTINLWDTKNWSILYSLETPEHTQAAAFRPDNKFLLTGGRDKTALGEFLQNFFGDVDFNKGVSMRLWDVRSGQLLQTFLHHQNDVNDVAFSPDGLWIAGGSSDKTISVWHLYQ